jgi:serine protease AprX
MKERSTLRGAGWTPGQEGVRQSALWGKRVGSLMLVALVALLAPIAALAAKPGPTATPGPKAAYLPSSLAQSIKAKPNDTYSVIVQGRDGQTSNGVADSVRANGGKVAKQFRALRGVAAKVNGGQLQKLLHDPKVVAVTPDYKLAAAAYEDAEMWRYTVHADLLWNTIDPLTGLLGPGPQAPAIAIVDSGIDATKLADFGTRVVAHVNLSSSPAVNTDDQGHGTMVAGIAAGASALNPGIAQNAPLVDVRTADKDGMSYASDVIEAADWILQNKDQYNIKVANFSMSGASDTSFRFDPLNKAVEKLWFNGVTVVVAAGNHGSETGPVSMAYAPGNDPFVITVGAVDQHQNMDAYDDTRAPWSAYGYTSDGFSKPDLVAPGRYMVMPIPVTSTIAQTVPDRVTDPLNGYMWMSGTSFAAPVVAGAAAQILARHPDWGPDEVKGALMLTSQYLGGVDWQEAGVGEIDAYGAASLDFTPPNPNENLYTFVETDTTTGGRTFNEASWANHVATEASWASASWASASWASASWANASWASASWSSASWANNVDSAMQPTATYSESTRTSSAFVE